MSIQTELHRYNIYASDRHVYDIVLPASEINYLVDAYWEVSMEGVAEAIALNLGFSDPVALFDKAWIDSLDKNQSAGGVDAMVLYPPGMASEAPKTPVHELPH